MKKTLYYLIIFFFLTFISLIFLEFAGRAYSFFVQKNMCSKSINIDKYKSKFDEDVGYIPSPGIKKGCSNETYIITNHSFRNYSGFEMNKSNILIVGDSFGFGDEVSDDETISFYLKKKHNLNTINAAVYGYGLDQALLRAEKVIKNKNIKKVILIIAPGGKLRTNIIKRHGISKPYYILDNSNNIRLIKPENKEFQYVSRDSILLKSFIFNKLSEKNILNLVEKTEMNNIDPNIISCKIITFFQTKFKKKNISLDVVFYRSADEILFQDSVNFQSTKIFQDCLKNNKIEFIDTYSILKKNFDKKLYVKGSYGHPTPFANKIVAELISNKIIK